MKTVPQTSNGGSSTALRQRLVAWPCTSLGRWSLGLLAGFVVLMSLFFAITSFYGGVGEVRRLSIQAGGRFFSLPLFASTLVAAFVSATAAGVAALTAIIRKGERSIVMLLPLLIGSIVMLFAIGELFEGYSR